MGPHLKIFIFCILFFVATLGYAETYPAIEDDNPSPSSQELAMEQWMNMRQHPELTETSGTEKNSRVIIRKAATSKAKTLSKSKTSKKVKSSIKKEGPGEAEQAPVEIDKAVGEIDKAKVSQDAGKAPAPAAADKAKPPGDAGKAKAPDGGSKAKSSAGAGKAKNMDDATMSND